uniref:Short chain dehydrogenase/reductase family 16C, member 5a n=1 Tax=Oncorhynchus tshawytscha TaxID=74940 RepID=A0AAZ3RJT2_ONCTS
MSSWKPLFIVMPIYYNMEKKNVTGEIVLITGVGIGWLMTLLSFLLFINDIQCVLWAVVVKDKFNIIWRYLKVVKREVGDNAGIVTGRNFMDAPDSLIEKTIEVNTMAHFWTYKAFLPAMTANNHGHLVSVASTAGLIGVNGLAITVSSKFAAIGFAESVALELLATGKDGVKTTIVCPHFMNTGMFDGFAIVFIRGYYPHCIFVIVFLMKMHSTP